MIWLGCLNLCRERKVQNDDWVLDIKPIGFRIASKPKQLLFIPARSKENTIPQIITEVHIAEAIRRISCEGIPRQRRSRGYCLLADGKHLPPKYTIALAHEIATGKFLDSDQFSGGVESNLFLRSRNFHVIVCDCGGRYDVSATSTIHSGQEPQAGRPSGDGRKHFSGPMRHRASPSSRSASTLRVAMVFPKLNGQPTVPSVDSFAGEGADLVLFPEAYICSSDERRTGLLRKLAADLGAPLLVGAYGTVDLDGRGQVLLRFDPGDSPPTPVYVKHSSADALAFEMPGWNPRDMLPTFEVSGVSAGATICQDSYLGLLPRYLGKHGARIWINPSYNNVIDIKWSSILRLRAVENRFFALCTLHNDMRKRTHTHPFAFSPDGNELSARKACSTNTQPLSKCTEAGSIYIVDLDIASASKPLDWSNLPHATKPKRVRYGRAQKPVHVALRDGCPAVYGKSGWNTSADGPIDTDHARVYLGVVPNERILDAAACFSVLDRAKQEDCRPIIWNQWGSLPTMPEQLATLMMGRAIECCAPIVISDRAEIHELVELSNRNKIPARRIIESSGEAIVDVNYAWGLRSAFKMVTKHLPRNKGTALDHYRSLGSRTSC